MKTRVCSKCKKRKAISKFGKHKQGRDGIRVCCKVCQREYVKAWVKANPEAYRKVMRVQMRKWTAKNRNRYRATQLAWRERNLDKWKAYHENYRQLKRELKAENKLV